VSHALKSRNPSIKVFLADPPGSSLYAKVTRGVLYTGEEAEGKRLRNPYDTIVEGMGLNRLTANFSRARIDGAYKSLDRETVEMAHYLMREEGLFLGELSCHRVVLLLTGI
jgi:cysteine synthase A